MKNLYAIASYIIICVLTLFFIYNHSVQKTSANTDEIKLMILMYHSFTNNSKESEYVISAKKFEDDITVLKKNGFTFIDTYDLTEYVSGKVKLPKKCVMLSFDDGYMNNYTYAYPIAKKHGVKFVVSPIAYFVEYYSINGGADPAYAQLTDKEIKEMCQSGLADFQNHSYNMHSLDKRKGSSKIEGEPSKDYVRHFYYDLKAAENVIKEITGKKTHAYVYPFGSVSKESEAILKCCGYKLTLGCEEGFNIIKRDRADLYKLKRFNRTPQRSAEHFLKHY